VHPMEGHRIRELERELGMCVDELTMLGMAFQNDPNFKTILKLMVENVQAIVDSMPVGNATTSSVQMIYYAINQAYVTVSVLDIETYDGWTEVYRAVLQLNTTLKAFEYGAGFLTDQKLKQVCTELVLGTNLPNASHFRNLTYSKNRAMLDILLKVGQNLSRLKVSNEPGFYGFMGANGTSRMDVIINSLTSIRSKT
jgi:hypothetical protein